MPLWKSISCLTLVGLVVAGSCLAGDEKKGAAADDKKPAAGEDKKMAAPGKPGEAPDTAPKLAIGTVVPDFTLKDSEGKEINLAKYRGDGIVVLTFLSKKCPVSHAYHPAIAAYAKDYGSKGVKFLGVRSNVTEETAEVATALKEQGITFPILDDPGYKLADAMDAMGTPHMYIIDKEGKLRYSGAICDNWKEQDKAEKHFFKDALDQVLAGKTVSDPHPDAFIGCTIKKTKQVG